MVIVSFMMSWYYITVLVWVLYFLYNSFFSPLPWSVCTNEWNTAYCIQTRQKDNLNTSHFLNASIASLYRAIGLNGSYGMNATYNSSLVGDMDVTEETPINKSLLTTAAKEFWQ